MLMLAVAPAGAGSAITGRASVIDGDTLEIAGHRIRLHGIDAPESGQVCAGADGRSYRCGQVVALALADRIGPALVTCETRDRDRYGRLVAVCRTVVGGLNAWLVREGHALAYRQYGREYVPDEDAARRARRRLWAGSFTPPSAWRRGARETVTADTYLP